MFCNRKRKTREGFILIYVMFLVTLCIFIAINCFKLEVLKRENSLNIEKDILRTEETQKIKEYILTDLDQSLNKNVLNLSNEGIRAYMNSLTGTIVKYENSYVEYNRQKDYFVLVYYLDGKFCKEEAYEYNVKDNCIYYNCIGNYFQKGASYINE